MISPQLISTHREDHIKLERLLVGCHVTLCGGYSLTVARKQLATTHAHANHDVTNRLPRATHEKTPSECRDVTCVSGRVSDHSKDRTCTL